MDSIILYIPQPFFNFINVIIANQYLSQWFPVQGPYTIMAILFMTSRNRKKMILHALAIYIYTV